jgi:eukaryotic-like serine/threonine-protein kinase
VFTFNPHSVFSRLVSAVLVAACCLIPGPRCLAGDAPLSGVSGWKIKFEESGSTPTVVDGAVYLGSTDGAVYALDLNTGATKWRFQTGENLAPAGPGSNVIRVPPGTSLDQQMSTALDVVRRLREQPTRRVDMQPVVAEGTVFIGSGDRFFYAIDAASGKEKWRYEAGMGMASTNNMNHAVPPASVQNNTVYLLTKDGLHSLDALSGKRNWFFQPSPKAIAQDSNVSSGLSLAGLALGDHLIFVTGWVELVAHSPETAFLYAVDPESGKAKWVVSWDGSKTTPPRLAGGLVFVGAADPSPDYQANRFSDHATLYALGPADGTIKWKSSVPSEFGESEMLVAENTVYFRTSTSVVALEAATGHQTWVFNPGAVRAFQADGQRIYAVSDLKGKDVIHALALSTGQENWSLAGGWVSFVRDGVLYSSGNHSRAIDANSGKEIWSYKGRESIISAAGGRVFLASETTTYVGTNRVDQGYLMAVDAKTGKLKP